jgi:Co/Zn/Cd efflux system component
MSSPNSTIAIFYAFAANLGIAAAKTFAAFWTGSGSLLADSDSLVCRLWKPGITANRYETV